MNHAPRWKIVDFADITPAPCPCGQARRALGDVDDYPATLHLTEISVDAQTHHHRTLTETYYILECGPDAAIELDGELHPLRPGMVVFIPPGVRHRAVGEMKILNFVIPKFDPTDEVLDEPG